VGVHIQFNALPGELEACEALELKEDKYYNKLDYIIFGAKQIC
jgi:hypothetical protein